MSDRRTQRSWPVEVAPFLMSGFAVTQSWYVQVTGERPSTAQGDRLPVEGLSWWDAVRFCNALSRREGLLPAYHLRADDEAAEWDTSAGGYRLPTEAEWEHACRAGTTGPRYGLLDEVAWYRGNSDGRVHAVGGKQPNAWGLYDMLGNVWEWCWDIYDAEVYGSGSGPERRHPRASLWPPCCSGRTRSSRSGPRTSSATRAGKRP